MNSITLYPYQQRLIDATRDGMAHSRRVIMTLPTGGGKTVCFSFMANTAAKRGKKVLILSSRTEIMAQNAATIRKYGADVVCIHPATKYIPETHAAVAMVQTLQRRVKKPEWQEYMQSIDLLIIDECHENISNFIFQYLSDKCYVVGVTATPRRYGGQEQLANFYKEIVCGPSVKELIALGKLTPAKHYSFKAPDLSDVKVDFASGDYNYAALAQKYETREQYAGVVENYQRICPNTKAIVFCVSATQAIETTNEFIDAGINAKYLLSDTSHASDPNSGDRDKVIEDFNNNRIKVLVNVGILVAGFDCPDVETIVFAYATQSITKWLQALGRGARIAPHKPFFYALDFGNNVSRLGLYDADRTWSLFHERKATGGVPPMKECPEDKGGCGRLIPAQSLECPFCGHIFPTDKEIYKIELEEIIGGETDEKNMTVAQWAAKMKLEGHSNSWILIRAMKRKKTEQYKAFNEARMVLKNLDGTEISEKYYNVLKKYILNERK